MAILVNLVLQTGCLICLGLKLVYFPCKVRDYVGLLVQLGLRHCQIIFALLAVMLLARQSTDKVLQGIPLTAQYAAGPFLPA